MSTVRSQDFEAYVDARGRAWERSAYALTHDRHAAQDLVQTVLLKVFRHWSRIVAVEQPDAYVRRMLVRTYLDQQRRRSSGERPAAGPLPEALAPDPAVGVVQRDEFRRALGALTPMQRAVLVLRHVEGLPDDEIAGVLGCTAATVRTHASRGRDRFRDALDGAAHGTEQEQR
ncbi:SigE family RNA polymerase sigma factor [Nakamurella endophytica]|uniref:RNA polymerase n=1 Tax=Nakamurella endophytica TaxID=1748367 RepID=A0A917WDM2_9ACTN|nr:SigE family RNA polymerase sigma factor [Nakamurella endophytica]GGL97448.1 RNA polymerase [Nakamurella endophytica]